MIRVLVADDQRVVREGLVTLLGLIDGIQVTGAAADGAEALSMVAERHPDVVLMDLRMPHMDGVEATRRITGRHPSTRVIVLTTYADDDSVFAALEAGALGYLTKDADAAEIARALRAVYGGQALLDPSVQRRVLESLRGGGRPAAGERPPAPDGLTPREVDVLRLIAEGLSNQEIAGRLSISEATIKTHVNNIFSKAGLRDRAQAVRYAFDNGLVKRP
jgi:DNA-binding NarL/FixJ family response regulator